MQGPGGRDARRIEMALAAGAIVGTWFWDVVRDRVTVDDALARAFGLDPQVAGAQPPLERILASVHPDDRPGVSEAIAEALAQGGRYAHQYRAQGADGQYRWIEAIGRVDLDAGGSRASFPAF